MTAHSDNQTNATDNAERTLQRRWFRGGWAYPALFVGSVVESSVLPWPIEFPLTAVMLRGRAHVFPAAITVWLGSVIGCALAFLAGAWAFEAVLNALSGRYDWAAGLAAARDDMAEQERPLVAVFAAMFTPAQQIASIAAGAAGLAFLPFLLVVTLGRALRFASMAILVFWFGETIVDRWRRAPSWLRRMVIVLALMAFVALTVYGLT